MVDNSSKRKGTTGGLSRSEFVRRNTGNKLNLRQYTQRPIFVPRIKSTSVVKPTSIVRPNPAARSTSTTPAARSTPSSSGRNWPSLGALASRIKSDSARPSSGGSQSSFSLPAKMSAYIALIVLAVAGLFIKNYVAYSPAYSLLISIVLGLIFFLAVANSPERGLKRTLIAVAFALDSAAQLILGLIPESKFRNLIISLHVFVWIILAVILFILGVLDAWGAGEKIGWLGTVTLVTVIGFILYLVFPLIAQSPLLYQDQTHADYYTIAAAEAEKVVGVMGEKKIFWSDYFSCLFEPVLKPQVVKKETLDGCLKRKERERLCKDAKDIPKCITDLETASAGGNFVQGAVSTIIKKVTKAELRIPEGVFPKKTFLKRQNYPLDLRMENQRELEGITGEVSCLFEMGKKEILGEVSIAGENRNSFAVAKFSSPQAIRINCQPSADLEIGVYKVKYQVILRNLVTPSFQKVVFASSLTEEQIKQIEADYFRTQEDRGSQSPADLAWMNVVIGNPHPERRGEVRPIIISGEVFPFVSSFENKGRGKIIAVNSYAAETILEKGFVIKQGEVDCLQGGGVPIFAPISGKYVFKNCYLQAPLEEIIKYKLATLKSEFNYDYLLEAEETTVIEEAITEATVA
ncbi:MAG: hypothetical protein AABW48_04515 [Nanoarchaeota archaeon]